MAASLKSAIVRIYNAGSTIVGAGFLVSDRHILTCAHVVADAFDLAQDHCELPQADLGLDFPLLAPGKIVSARVVHWAPERDVAGLKLEETLPDNARPVWLVESNELWNHTFRAFGFPPGREDGVWASGVLRDRQADGWLQIEDVKDTGYRVGPGFSGGPVWDETLGGVAGMVTAADTQVSVKAAFIIPSSKLVHAWPILLQQLHIVSEGDPVGKALQLVAEGNVAEAISVLETSAETEPGRALVHYNLGVLYDKLGDTAEAIRQYRRATELGESFGGAFYNLGRIYIRSGLYDDAERELTMALEINPAHFDAINALGGIEVRRGNFEKAISMFKQVLAIRPGHALVLNNLADALMHIGKPDDALNAIKKARRANPSNEIFQQTEEEIKGRLAGKEKA
jgi:Flp pilus assembly protein TadD